jgi:hypothetical protein
LLAYEPRFSELESGQFSPSRHPLNLLCAATKENGKLINAKHSRGKRGSFI